MRLAGVDGCPGGWVVASADAALQRLEFAILADLQELVAAAAACRLFVAIDMPIGLPEDGDRACDRAARRLLGRPRGSSVFPVPCRPALAATAYPEACRLNAAASGRRLTRETFNIIPRIRALDRLVTPVIQTRVRECHPEVAFALLAGRPPVYAKKTPAGEAERLALLVRRLPSFEPAAVRAALGPALVRCDDILDAAVCLLTAARCAAGLARVLPAGTVPLDVRGLRMEIVG